ncbi:hypothetical protein D3C85_999170 [compost metagenome]
MDECRRDTEQAQALAGRGQQAGITAALEREKLFLCSGPVRNQQVDQRRPGLEHIARCSGIDPLDEASGAGLHHGDLAFVEGQHTDHIQAVGQRSTADGDQAQAEVLGQAGVDSDGRAVRSAAGILRHQLHVHEG